MSTLAPEHIRGFQTISFLLQRRFDPFHFFSEVGRRENSWVHLQLGQTRSYLIANADIAKHVLLDNFANYPKGKPYKKVEAILGRGLVTQDGERWKRSRVLLQPIFAPPAIRKIEDHMKIEIQRTVEKWKELQGQPLAVVPQMQEATFRIFMSAFVGAEATQGVGRIAHYLTSSLARFEKELTNPKQVLAFFRKDWMKYAFEPLQESPNESEMRSFLKKLIQARKEHIPVEGEPPSILDQLIKAYADSNMSDLDVEEEMKTLLFAGFETTANALSWSVELLAEHPEYQERILKNPAIADQVFLEAMRLYPPTWRIARETLEADEVAGVKIPAGAMMVISVIGLHRNPQYWKDANKFLPERHESQDPSRPKYAFLPYSAGPRACLGSHLANLEGGLILRALVENFKIVREGNRFATPLPFFMLQPKNQSPIRFINK